MKNKLIPLLLATLMLVSCGSKPTAPVAPVVSSTPEVSVNKIPYVDFADINPDNIAKAYLEGDIDIQYDMEKGHFYIFDGDKTIYFFILEAPDPRDVYKKDVDGDGIEEYLIITCSGHGTGFYQTDLYIIKEGFYEPVGKLTAQTIYEKLNNDISYEYDEETRELSLMNSSELLGTLPLGPYLDEWEGTFHEMVIGDIISIKNESGTYSVEADLGIITTEYSIPDFSYTFNVYYPIIIDGYDISLGEISAEIYDHGNRYSENQ